MSTEEEMAVLHQWHERQRRDDELQALQGLLKLVRCVHQNVPWDIPVGGILYAQGWERPGEALEMDIWLAG